MVPPPPPSPLTHTHTANNATKGGGGADGTHPNYVAFVLVPVFFLLGLLGVVICHVLKRKGYRCTTEPQDGEGEACWDGHDAELGEGEERFFVWFVCFCSPFFNSAPSKR